MPAKVRGRRSSKNRRQNLQCSFQCQGRHIKTTLKGTRKNTTPKGTRQKTTPKGTRKKTPPKGIQGACGASLPRRHHMPAKVRRRRSSNNRCRNLQCSMQRQGRHMPAKVKGRMIPQWLYNERAQQEQSYDKIPQARAP